MKILFLFISLFSFSFYSCQSQPSNGSVDAITFSTQLNVAKDPVVLDVRSPQEFADGYINSAVNIDYHSPDFKSRVAKLDKDKTYFVYCAAGGRSKSAVEIMRREGFYNIFELNGGITEWQNNNLPVVHKSE